MINTDQYALSDNCTYLGSSLSHLKSSYKDTNSTTTNGTTTNGTTTNGTTTNGTTTNGTTTNGTTTNGTTNNTNLNSNSGNTNRSTNFSLYLQFVYLASIVITLLLLNWALWIIKYDSFDHLWNLSFYTFSIIIF